MSRNVWVILEGRDFDTDMETIEKDTYNVAWDLYTLATAQDALLNKAGMWVMMSDGDRAAAAVRLRLLEHAQNLAFELLDAVRRMDPEFR